MFSKKDLVDKIEITKLTLMLAELKFFTESEVKITFVSSYRTASYHDTFD